MLVPVEYEPTGTRRLDCKDAGMAEALMPLRRTKSLSPAPYHHVKFGSGGGDQIQSGVSLGNSKNAA